MSMLSKRAGAQGRGERGSKLHSLSIRPSDEETVSKGWPFIRRMPFSERSSLPCFLALASAGLLLTALPAVAKPKAVPVQTAVIENSGSTNTVGYTIEVSPTGSSRYHMGDNSPLGPRTPFGPTEALSKLQTKKFFADLDSAMPLTSLPVRHGMRSASFGTQTFITYAGQKSPDLTFASDPRSIALKADIESIRNMLHIRNDMRHPVVIMRKAPFINH